MQLYTPTCNATDADLGGKAAGLRALDAAGYAIPGWFVVPATSYSPEGLATDKCAALIEAARALAGNGLLAVRSSARDEDGTQQSFAGQFDSVLAVTPEAVPGAVARVWQSAFTSASRAYRQQHDLQAPEVPAVLVQRQLDPDVAGVAFSADPVAGRWDETLVSAVPGCGTALVNGDSDADAWRVERSGRIAHRDIAHKVQKHTLHTNSQTGVSATPVLDADADSPCLDDQQVIEVANMTRILASLRGAPQDIEFAYADGTLHLLQSRPITTLGSTADPGGALALWDNANIAESYGGITSPLTYSFARNAYEHVYRQFCRMLGVDEPTINANGHVFGTMIGLVRGRVYYNLLNWHRLLALLPGYRVNRGFMEQMMGVDETLAEEFSNAVRPTSGSSHSGGRDLDGQGDVSKWRDLTRLVRTSVGLVGSFLNIGRDITRFQSRLDATLAPTSVALTDLRIDELAAHYRMLESRLLTRWDAPLTNDLLAMIFYGATRSLARTWLGDKAGTLQNDLIGGEGGVISTEPAERVRRMALEVRGDIEWTDLLSHGTVPEVIRALDAKPELARQFHDYLSRFGDRCLDELKLESASLDDDPKPLFRSIAAFAASAHCGDVNHARAARAEAEAVVARNLTNPVKRMVFSWFLKHARERVRCRENLRFERTRLFGRVRRVVVEMGKRLAAAGVLAQPRDVFYVEIQELLGFVEGTASCTDLESLVQTRKQQYVDFADGPVPSNRFRTTGAVHIGNTFRSNNPSPDLSDAATQAGTGACPGVVRGPARVVRDPQGVILTPGTVLVAERTDPGWIMLFPAATGLVVERGSLLSHSAIVARELGLPTVVGVANATSWIADGDIIELDGASGEVRKIEKAEAS